MANVICAATSFTMKLSLFCSTTPDAVWRPSDGLSSLLVHVHWDGPLYSSLLTDLLSNYSLLRSLGKPGVCSILLFCYPVPALKLSDNSCVRSGECSSWSLNPKKLPWVALSRMSEQSSLSVATYPPHLSHAPPTCIVLVLTWWPLIFRAKGSAAFADSLSYLAAASLWSCMKLENRDFGVKTDRLAA